mmetsp:Transcript_32408/g.97548  ORF Transcript_32408/g.97548 Transcript_32408/m.97548 type:complete len:1102 (-) Transcript_32408:398-3703(-)
MWFDAMRFDRDEPAGVHARACTMLPGGRRTRTASALDSEEATLEQIYKAMMLDETTPMGNPITTAINDAVSVCVLIMGSSKSRKCDAFQGPYSGPTQAAPSQIGESHELGLAGLIIRDLFARLAVRDAKLKCAISFKFVELYDELITDLIHPPTSQEVVFVADTCRGASLRGASAPRVHSADDALALLKQGRSKRNGYADALAAECTACYIELELHHLILAPATSLPRVASIKTESFFTEEEMVQGWTCASVSRIAIVEVPSTHKLAVPPEKIIFEEGSTKNQSLLSLASCIQELSKPLSMRKTVPFESSHLTRLLEDVLGGNGLLRSLACGASSDSPEALAAMLGLQRQIGNMRQFPVSQTQSLVSGLVMRNRALVKTLREAVSKSHHEISKRSRHATDGTKQIPSNERFKALECSLAKSKLDAVSARKDTIKIYKVLELLRHRYTNVAELKAHQANELAITQQEKLEISKVLLEAKLQECRAKEAIKNGDFAAESELLLIRDQTAALSIQCDALRSAEVQARNQVTLLSRELDKARVHLGKYRLKAIEESVRYDALCSQKTLEQARNIELSAELLKVMAERDETRDRLLVQEQLALQAETSKNDLQVMFAEKIKKNDHLMQSVLQMRIELTELQAKHLHTRAKLEHARMDVGRALLDRDSTAADLFAKKEAEIMEMKSVVHGGLLKLKGIRSAGETDRLKATKDAQAASRQVRELNLTVSRVETEVVQIHRDRCVLGDRLTALEASFRARLNKDLMVASSKDIIKMRLNSDRLGSPCFSLSVAAFVSRFIDLREPSCFSNLAFYYQEVAENFQNMEDNLLENVQRLKSSEKRAITHSRILRGYCQRLQDTLASHAPEVLDRLQYKECGTLEVAGVESAIIAALQNDREKYSNALAKARSKLTEQQNQAISAIRELQNACKKEQERSARVMKHYYGLRVDVDRRDAKLRATQDMALVQAALRADHQHHKIHDTDTLARIEVLQQRIVDGLEKAQKKSKSVAQAPASHKDSKISAEVRQRLVLARKQVQALYRHINGAALSSHDETNSARSPHKLLVAEEANMNCIQLAYRVTILDEELAHYREYMKKTVRRYQRTMRLNN